VKIRAIIWDFAGVLLHTVRGTFNSLLANRLGMPLSAVDAVMDSHENDLWDMGEMSDEEFYAFVMRSLGLPPEMKAVIARFTLEDFTIDQDLLAYIRRLRQTYISALLTNFPAHLYEHMRIAWHVDGAFDHIIASCDVKLIKPDPRMYALALERMSCRAEEILFIDDREENVHTAESMGIQSVLYLNREQTIRDVDHLLSHQPESNRAGR